MINKKHLTLVSVVSTLCGMRKYLLGLNDCVLSNFYLKLKMCYSRKCMRSCNLYGCQNMIGNTIFEVGLYVKKTSMLYIFRESNSFLKLAKWYWERRDILVVRLGINVLSSFEKSFAIIQMLEIELITLMMLYRFQRLLKNYTS